MNAMIIIQQSLPLLLKGFGMTLKLWFVCSIISLVVGTLVGLLRSKKLHLVIISPLLDGITAILRGIPFYIQLLIAYYVVPGMLGINFSAFTAATVSLGLCSAAYVSQMVRASIDGIPRGQWEAAQVLGLSRKQTIKSIVIPQTMPTMIPLFCSELDQLLKSTAIISTIGLLELTRAGMNIIAREMIPTPIYILLASVYLLLSLSITFAGSRIECWYSLWRQ